MTNQVPPYLMGPESKGYTLLSESPDDFEALLTPRTKVPPQRLAEYLSWTNEKLQDEAAQVSTILKRFAEAVVNAMESPTTANDFLLTLDLKAISRDHDWRTVFSALRMHEAGYEEHKRAFVVKYLQYLSFRKRLLEFIHAKKSGLEETDAYEEVTVYPAGVGSAKPVQSLRRVSRPASGPRAPDGFSRLPMGEPVDVPLAAGRKVNIMMAGHIFRLMGSSPPCLVDQNGVTSFLKQGRSMVGRHPESDLVIDPDFREVSRAHMILEWDGGDNVRVMDFSSRGTFLPSKYLNESNAWLVQS